MASFIAAEASFKLFSLYAEDGSRSFFKGSVANPAENIIVEMQNAAAQINKKIADLDKIIITLGGGGFTGIRIPISAALGVAFASDVSLVGVSTMQALACRGGLCADSDIICRAVGDSYYHQRFNEDMTAADDIKIINDIAAFQPSSGNVISSDVVGTPTAQDIADFYKKYPELTTDDITPIYAREAV